MTIQSDAEDAEEVDPGLLSRFKELVEAAGKRQGASELTGNSTQQIAKWSSGKARIPFWQAAILAKATGKSLDWLAFGGGQVGVLHQSMAMSPIGDDPDVAMIAKLDVIASAGPGFENPYPYELDRLPFPRQWLDWLGVPEEAARFLDSRGDSMWPTIPEGAVCLADIRHQRPRLDGVYVLLDGDNVRIKRIGRGFEGRIELISDNEKYPNETLAGPEAEALRVAGKVVWAGGKI